MVREIPLTRGLVALVGDEDFGVLNQFNWHANPGEKTFYAKRKTSSQPYTNVHMHHQVLGVSAIQRVDHIDGNGLNNVRSNLRVATHGENARNVKIQKRNRSGFKGVSWETRSNRWKAAIQADKRCIFIGLFRCPEQAAHAYDAKAREVHGAFACLNFPLPGERSAR